ncbi:MAG: hypothetical protein ABSD85_01240 [Acidimicrobiales bacterium]
MRPEPGQAAAVALVSAAFLVATLAATVIRAGPPAAASTAHAPSQAWQSCVAPRHLSETQIVVPVVVDFGGPAAKVLVTCVVASTGETGAQVLEAQAHLVGYPTPRYATSGLLCAIDGYPRTGCGSELGAHYAYWAYWHAGRRWQYANDGPGEWTVSKGDVEGWRFEPDGSASPADPPPRAFSTAAALEATVRARPSTGGATTLGSSASTPSGDAAGPIHQVARSGGATTPLFGACVALIVLIGAATLLRARRASGRAI